jgi:hypothetical protein
MSWQQHSRVHEEQMQMVCREDKAVLAGQGQLHLAVQIAVLVDD